MHMKSRLALSAIGKQKRCLMKLLMFIHMKRLSKEDNKVCWISNSHQLNKVMRHKQYLLPIIMDVLRKCSGYKFFTKLDIGMQYYMFELDNKSQDSRTIITPFGKNKYLRLLMGLKSSEVESKTILMGHPISCCHAPVVRSFFIHCKMIISP